MKRPVFIAKHARRPHGVIGLIVAEIMSRETRRDNLTAIEILNIRNGEHIVDIGTGHGRALKDICRVSPSVSATGIDDSSKMLAIAARKNARLVASDRVSLVNSSSDALPCDNESFDGAMAVNTIYFWSDPRQHFREILRVLRPGGRFVIGFHSGGDPAFEAQFPTNLYRFRTEDDVTGLLEDSGFGTLDRHESREIKQPMTFLTARKSL
jgi:SAM-dependent methyltransferase